MRLVFLGARLPLTKTIACHKGAYSVAPYPNVVRLTSHQTDVGSLQEFHAALVEHSRAARCLFNGQLLQPLNDESRAGKTAKDVPRSWVVFDFDKVDGTDAEDVVKTYLPDYCHNVSYIAQRSSSMFVPGVEDVWSGHIFMLLKTSIVESDLRGWFEHLNFTVPALVDSLTLTDSGLALHWPLDRTAAYDSKLIYIAPPRCVGFEPTIPTSAAIQLIKKRQAVLSIPSFVAPTKDVLDAKVNELRTAAGMPTRTFATRKFEDHEVLIDAEPGVINDVRAIGNHYIKFNLNGGDSFGYWIDLRNPRIIKNFKGEPYLLTKEVDEKFYKALMATAPKIVAQPALDEGCEVLAFYATNQEATVRTGIFNPIDRRLRLDKSTESAAGAWLANYGVLRKGHLPHYDVEFDPSNDNQFIPGHPVINTYRATDYIMSAASTTKPSTLEELPPLTKRIMQSILGDTDGRLMKHFVNWLAFIFQTRCKSTTAWVMHGIEGTGKGMFFEYWLAPVFGSDVVRLTNFALASTSFNTFIDNALIVVFDEATLSSVDNNDDLMMKLNNWITEPRVEIHAKGKSPVQRRSYANFLFYTNKRNPVVISNTNRRFNVANRQETRFYLTPNEILRLKNESELPQFADVLKRWPVEDAAVRKILETDDLKIVHEQTTSTSSQIADAILKGDIQFFIDRTPSKNEAMSDFHNRFDPSGMYRTLLDDIITGAKTVITGEDLFILFRTLIPDTRYFQDSKVWRTRHYQQHGLNLKPVRVGTTVVRGIKVDWQKPSAPPEKQRPPSNVRAIK